MTSYFISSNNFEDNTLYHPYLEIEYEYQQIAEYAYDEQGRPNYIGYGNGMQQKLEYDPVKGYLTTKAYTKYPEKIDLSNEVVNTDLELTVLDSLTIEKTDLLAGSTTSLTSQNEIVFKDGFHAQMGSALEAKITALDDSQIFALTNHYDRNGNVIKQDVTHADRPAKKFEYSYDDLSQLKTFELDDVLVRQYDYDPNGNITLFGNHNFGYSNGNNQLTTDGSNIYEYNNMGQTNRIFGDAEETYDYDIFSNQTHYSFNDQNVDHAGSFYYDSYNMRILKVQETRRLGTTVNEKLYYVNDNLNNLAVYDQDHELKYEDIFDDMGALYQYDHNNQQYLFNVKDHLGNIRAMVNSNRDIVMSRDYYPFGEEYEAIGEKTLYDFSGKEKDDISQDHYFGARYYDAKIGRFLTVDPKHKKMPDYSPYVYAFNNPLIFVDPDGKETTTTVQFFYRYNGNHSHTVTKITTITQIRYENGKKIIRRTIIKESMTFTRDTEDGGFIDDDIIESVNSFIKTHFYETDQFDEHYGHPMVWIWLSAFHTTGEIPDGPSIFSKNQEAELDEVIREIKKTLIAYGTNYPSLFEIEEENAVSLRTIRDFLAGDHVVMRSDKDIKRLSPINYDGKQMEYILKKNREIDKALK
jgi:RHS repeat-associated protein